ncbi:MAG: nicotinate phosphoribosyltransferase [Mycoplasmataceae bacterium]|jgi:nicotinate phosphoribosyltransferase|nr:nicotinate phosphoribosyltransferase [Mycoplasmataceae bacterium]
MIKFKFDPKLKQGYYSANYFNKVTKLVKKYKPNEIVCMQFVHFGNEPVMVCGITETIQLLKFCLTKKELDQIEVYGLKDGDITPSKSPVILIFGHYQIFAKYENVIDGILARRSSVCNNCYQILKMIDTNQLIFMADRTDDYSLQPYDGYSAYVAGVRHFVTEASVKYIKNDSRVTVGGTMPHSLIQEFDGDLNQTMVVYSKEYGSAKAVALIDYHNDIGSEIKKLAKKLHRLYAVRIDTSSNMLDVGLKKYGKNKSMYGVNPTLIKYARRILDKVGFKDTKIITSSGINYEKIQEFQKEHVPVDFYGIGSSLITRNVHFTADLVLKNNHHQAKVGRKLFIDMNRIKTLKKYI